MLPPSSRYKHISSGTDLVDEAGYKDRGHRTKDQGIKKGTQSEPMGKNDTSKAHIGFFTDRRWTIEKEQFFPVINCRFQEESRIMRKMKKKNGRFHCHRNSFSQEESLN
jgi:hypothetical protein